MSFTESHRDNSNQSCYVFRCLGKDVNDFNTICQHHRKTLASWHRFFHGKKSDFSSWKMTMFWSFKQKNVSMWRPWCIFKKGIYIYSCIYIANIIYIYIYICRLMILYFLEMRCFSRWYHMNIYIYVIVHRHPLGHLLFSSYIYLYI